MRGNWLLACLVVAALTGPAMGQSPERTHRLAVLMTNAGAVTAVRTAITPELARLGFAEGRNLVIDYRVGGGSYLPLIARDLIETKPDIVVGVGTNVVQALQAATQAIPIVMSLGPDDPVASGFAKSMARPGTNVTGVVALSSDLDGKRLELLREAVPSVHRLGVLHHNVQIDLQTLRELSARTSFDLRGVRLLGTREDYQGAFTSIRALGAEAILIGSAPLFSEDVRLLVEQAMAERMPTMCEWRELAVHGCLISYGPSLEELRRRTAHFIARIFRGAAPGDLPIEGPTRFEYVVNLRTAKAIGVTIPAAMLASADEVIE